MESMINQSLCQKCKLCIDVCPTNIIGNDTENNISFIPERMSICLHCGQCMAICNTKAISIEGLNYDRDFIELPEGIANNDQFLNLLANRRSIRNFKNKPVSGKTIEKILEAISYAPYGAHPEKINITVINNREIIETALPHIEEFLDNIVKWVENPISSFIIRKKKGMETFNTIKNHLYPIAKLDNYKLRYGDRITRDAPAIVLFHAEKGAEEHSNNSMIYATYLILSAQSLGLGASMIGIIPAAINKLKKVREIFHIPDNNNAVMSVIIGYPKYSYKRTIKRNVQNIHWIK